MGRKSKREGTGCVRRADSLCCTAETSTRLESNYTPVKIWKKKKNCLPHAMKTELEIWALTSLLWNEYLISGLKPHRARTGRAVKKMKDLPPKEEGELPQVPQQLLAKSGSSWVPTARFSHRSASLREGHCGPRGQLWSPTKGSHSQSPEARRALRWTKRPVWT